MAYTFSDASGKTIGGPSINSLRQIKALLTDAANSLAIEQLLEHGHTNLLIALATECTNLAKKTNDVDIKHSLGILAKFARNADEIVVLEH